MADLNKTMQTTERLFMDQVVRLAQQYGWLVFHPTPHRIGDSMWRTDGQGFPDLVLAHSRHGFIMAELKTSSGVISQAQKRWANAVSPHAEFYFWRPIHLQAIANRFAGDRDAFKEFH